MLLPKGTVFALADGEAFELYRNIGPDTAPATFTFSNNLWFCVDDPLFDGPDDLPVPETDPVIQLDPVLANPVAMDFHIPPAGPATGAGICLIELNGDLDGECYADPPAIGALEAP